MRIEERERGRERMKYKNSSHHLKKFRFTKISLRNKTKHKKKEEEKN